MSRRGSYIAEAAVVLPFVMLAIITTVLIIMYFYESSVSESRMHMALRCEAGLITEKSTAYAENTALSPEELWDGSLTTSGAATAKRVSGSKNISMASAGLLSGPGRRQISGQLRAVDPVRALRLRQIVRPEESDDSGATGGEATGTAPGSGMPAEAP